MKLNQMMRRIRSSKDISQNTFILILVILIGLKLFLISSSDVIGHPRDPFIYILMSHHKVWFPEEPTLSIFSYSQGYPAFILLANLLKIPLRTSHELLYTLANLFLIYSLRSLKISRVVCVILFAILTFHLATFQFFNTIVTESIVISFYHIVVALNILIITKKKSVTRIILSILCGLVIGLILITRSEQLIFYLTYALITIAIIFVFSRGKNRQFNPELHHCLIYLYRIPHSGYDSQDIFEADC
jgi:hypothetical protein